MQLAVPEVTDLPRETAATRTLYGLDRPETADFGRSCLLARRLLEQGVRFVQLFSGGSFGSPRINWDGHENMKQNHGQEAARIDQPVAALLATCASAACSTTRSSSSPPSSAARRSRSRRPNVVGTGRDHNHVRLHASGWPAAGLKHGIAYARPAIR